MDKDEKALEAVERFKEFLESQGYKEVIIFYGFREGEEYHYGSSSERRWERIGFLEDIKTAMIESD